MGAWGGGITRSNRTQISNRRYAKFPWRPLGWGRSPDPDRDRLCLPSGSVGSIPSRGTSTTGQSEFRNKQTNKQTNRRGVRCARLRWYALKIVPMMRCQLPRPCLGEKDLGVHISASVVSDQHAGLPTGAALVLTPPTKSVAARSASTRIFPTPRPRPRASSAASDGWMPGYWHQCARMHVPGMLRHFDPLADKIMCDHCCNKHPLGLYYFSGVQALRDRG